MDLYNRQEKLKLDSSMTVTVVGCGGIGYWVGKILAMSGIQKILLFDPDTLEEHNLNRLDIPLKYVGKNKADMTKGAIQGIRPEVVCYAFPFPYGDLAEKTDWVIDCTDDSEAQLKNQEIAGKLGAKYFKAGYDGEGFGIHNTVAEWGESTEGYTIVPSWSVPAMIVACLAVAKVMKYPDKEVISSVGHLFRFDR
jgi:molybdopterin/thiamine biosynthesis adenylyltransferase